MAICLWDERLLTADTVRREWGPMSGAREWLSHAARLDGQCSAVACGSCLGFSFAFSPASEHRPRCLLSTSGALPQTQVA
jgi:hypothetical protein